MLLYLLRHADADTPAASDAVRQLSEKGVAQVKRVAQFCRAHEIAPEIILTSPLVRARQTAEHFAAELGGGNIQIAGFIASGMRPDAALTELKAYEKMVSVMVVGHEPDFSLLIAKLLGMGSSEHLHVRKASLTALEVGAFKAAGARLEFSLPVRFMAV